VRTVHGAEAGTALEMNRGDVEDDAAAATSFSYVVMIDHRGTA